MQEIKQQRKYFFDPSFDSLVPKTVPEENPDFQSELVAKFRSLWLFKYLGCMGNRGFFRGWFNMLYHGAGDKEDFIKFWRVFIESNIHLPYDYRIKFSQTDLSPWFDLPSEKLPQSECFNMTSYDEDLDEILEDLKEWRYLQPWDVERWNHEMVQLALNHIMEQDYNQTEKDLALVHIKKQFKDLKADYPEIQGKWIQLQIDFQAKIDPALETKIQSYVVSTGRVDLLVPIFQKMLEKGERNLAEKLLQNNRSSFHPVTVLHLEKVLQRKTQEPASFLQ